MTRTHQPPTGPSADHAAGSPAVAVARPLPRTALSMLALAAFAAVTTEMLPVGVLPAIGTTFGVGEAVTGRLVSLYAMLVAVFAVPLTIATKRVPGKLLIVLATTGYAVSNLISALAPTIEVFAAGRALGGLTHALFFSVCIGYAARLVPPAQAGRALALTSIGPSAGFVLGVPLSTGLAHVAGWRYAFGALVALMVLVSLLIVRLLPGVARSDVPRSPAPARPGITSRPRGRYPLDWRMLAAGAVVLANTLVFFGHYTLYTYVSVLLLRSGATESMVAPILLVFGALGLVAVWKVGPQLDRRPRRSALVVVGLIALGMAAVGGVVPVLPAVIAAGAVWSASFGPVPSLFQSAVVRTRAMTPEVAGAWINSTSNVGIASGAALGGVVLDHLGIREVAWTAAILTAVALIVVVRAHRAFPATTGQFPARHS